MLLQVLVVELVVERNEHQDPIQAQLVAVIILQLFMCLGCPSDSHWNQTVSRCIQLHRHMLLDECKATLPSVHPATGTLRGSPRIL
jgi:hypothetical protein